MTYHDSITRRRFAYAVSALTGFAGFPAFANATPSMRFGVHTTEGKKMLAIYRDAVAAMTDGARFKEGDPRSWMFQWYIHAVRRDRGKVAELKRVYAAGDPNRKLAEKVWETCEAHRPASRGEDYFLPWHRMYVHFLEDIVRTVTGKSEFTLPYWDYTAEEHRSLPEEFLRKSDPQWKVLFRPDRNDFANDGKRIDQSGLPIDLLAMTARYYGDSDTEAGFCNNLDGQLHGNVHVSVGNNRGMGNVPWAANDPIFWLHHCNIDRIWASWTKAGGGAPPESTFSEVFNFADGQGKAVQAKVQDYIANSVVSYDTYLPRPAGSPPFPSGGPLLTSVKLRFLTKKAVPLRAAPLVVQLSRETDSGPLLTSGAALGDVPPETPMHVVLDGIVGNEAAESSTFEVHVMSGKQLPKPGDKESYIGALSLFGVGGHGGHAAHSLSHRRKVSYLVQGSARAALATQGVNPRVILIPKGNVKGQASIATVAVVTG